MVCTCHEKSWKFLKCLQQSWNFTISKFLCFQTIYKSLLLFYSICCVILPNQEFLKRNTLFIHSLLQYYHTKNKNCLDLINSSMLSIAIVTSPYSVVQVMENDARVIKKSWKSHLFKKNLVWTMFYSSVLVLQEAVPFAVIGANTVIEVKGRKVRGRMYPWGVVEVENPEHCDFIKLRTMLMWVNIIQL